MPKYVQRFGLGLVGASWFVTLGLWGAFSLATNLGIIGELQQVTSQQQSPTVRRMLFPVAIPSCNAHPRFFRVILLGMFK